ncbi:hypothetical protein DUNSADRAFT_12068 [Dunaliella salina]|uniref:DUF7605 domain-containing protein n=1 Tax=Dunaliella salina TaxID=3046 RepID=A0ABQ7H429_DUNSA|nr:hypothetical protein DUNSADRAFT_12068 [Dunaliella salina]|eukprot:KAF5841612.1 hypothetical protein DUNSADRAFT_12068 [Dunaliella salina]
MMASAVDGACEHANKQQRDINRLITPEVKQQMLPAYQAGYAECGPGSTYRRRDIMERHVSQHRVAMFKKAILPISQGMELPDEFKAAGDEDGDIEVLEDNDKNDDPGNSDECSESEDEEEAAFFARMAERERSGGGGAGSSSSGRDGKKPGMRKVTVQSAEVIDLCD